MCRHVSCLIRCSVIVQFVCVCARLCVRALVLRSSLLNCWWNVNISTERLHLYQNRQAAVSGHWAGQSVLYQPAEVTDTVSWPRIHLSNQLEESQSGCLSAAAVLTQPAAVNAEFKWKQEPSKCFHKKNDCWNSREIFIGMYLTNCHFCKQNLMEILGDSSSIQRRSEIVFDRT